MEDDKIIQKRKNSLQNYFTKNNSIIYLILAIIVFLVVRIRTLNIPGLRDVSNGEYTLGPDLDPFFFLRWAKTIVSEGALPLMDMMRYVPLGFNVKEEYLLHPYMMAWFHKVATIFGSESVTYSAIIYPVFFFALTAVAFFFLVREVFKDNADLKKANIIALISTFLLGVSPTLLPRTIAGIPEKESAAFFFLFAAFFFFIKMWKENNIKKKYLMAVLAGLATAGMALIWGGYIYIFIVLIPVVFVFFMFDKIGKKEIYGYALWMILTFSIMIPFKESYTLKGILGSISTGSAVLMLFIILVDHTIHKTNIKKYFKNGNFVKLPPKVLSLLVSGILGVVLSSLVLGFSFIPRLISEISSNLIKPATSRLIQTVAENRQPYFGEWAGNFGPNLFGFPVFFWLFFIGSIYLFVKMIGHLNKREKTVITSSYVIFLFAIIFSRFSSSSSLNGENTLSLFIYGFGFVAFVGTLGYYYYKNFKSGTLNDFGKVDFGILFVFFFFFFGIVSARAAVRTVMVLVPPASIIVSYFAVSLFYKARKEEKEKKVVAGVLALLVIIPLIYSGLAFYETSSQSAKAFVPSSYNQQWQLAMSWVRDNTSQDAVFGHWWDYGYWVQTIGERATILDGGNSISYWNHLMGRHVLTGQSSQEAAEFLYAHEATHFLIDSSDIGKYPAYSFIGSDITIDRRSWINTFLRDNNQVFQTKDTIVYLYTGGTIIDSDIVYINEEGSRIFLPGINDNPTDGSVSVAGIGGMRIEIDSTGNILQPVGVYIWQGQQHEIPLRYAFYGEELIDFGSGLEAGVFFYPRVVEANGGVQLEENGAAIYLSPRTIDARLTRLYLFGEEDSFFSLSHTQDDSLVASLESQGSEVGDFIYFRGFRGPIKIWEVDYPGISLNERFLETEYPAELRNA